MNDVSEDIIIETDKEKIKEKSTVFLGFPDVGLIGPIVVKQLMDQLEMEEIGYIESDKFPPITTVHDARPTHPMRIFGKDNFIAVTSEIPITPGVIHPFSRTLLSWLGEIDPEKVVILGGMPNQNRAEIDESEVHGVPSADSMEDLLKENDLHVLEDAFVTGINGILLRDLYRNDISTLYLLADSFQKYPDPGAAASVLKALNNMEGLDIDVEELKEKEEEIKVATRDLMRQTQKAMQKVDKDREEEMPVMYG